MRASSTTLTGSSVPGRRLQCPNAGDVLVSAAEGWEFADLGGKHHRGGGSHGSLLAGDSEVPMLAVGLAEPPRRIIDIAPAILGHFGVETAADGNLDHRG